MENKFNTAKQARFAETLKSLHHSDETLVLANVWDAVSAKMIENIGFPVLATSSAGVAWSLGYKDGEKIPPNLMVEAISRISNAVNVPITADIEGGYFRDDLHQFSQFIEQVVEAGAVGVNLEDGRAHSENLTDTDFQCKVIQTAKEAGKKMGINLFVNARTDAMILTKDLAEKIEISIAKAHAFEAAGADCVFVPFISEIETVAELKKNIDLPLNILASKMLDVKMLKALGVNRISVGSRPLMALMNRLHKIGETLKNEDDWSILFEEYPSYDELNNWF